MIYFIIINLVNKDRYRNTNQYYSIGDTISFLINFYVKILLEILKYRINL